MLKQIQSLRLMKSEPHMYMYMHIFVRLAIVSQQNDTRNPVYVRIITYLFPPLEKKQRVIERTPISHHK